MYDFEKYITEENLKIIEEQNKINELNKKYKTLSYQYRQLHMHLEEEKIWFAETILVLIAIYIFILVI